MTAVNLDDRLRSLHAAADRVSANLVELEIDSSRQLLAATTLDGESAAAWETASAALTELWRRHGLLEDLLERADKLRGSRKADELRSLLEGPSIELASTDVPLARRSLLGADHETQRCTPDQLLLSMSSTFDEVKAVVVRIGDAWAVLIPKLDRARRLLEEARRLAAELGSEGRDDIEHAAGSVAALGGAITSNPLAVATDEVETLIRTLDALREDLERSAALKQGFEARIASAHERFEQLRVAVREAHAAREELLLKITVSAPPSAPVTDGDLEADLSPVVEHARRGDWSEARAALSRWEARAEEQLEDARRARDANRAPIEARNQLRALLEAYQVKAARLGALEDPEVSAIHAEARDSLYTAPTDLARAAQLVRTYQRALSGSMKAPEVTP